MPCSTQTLTHIHVRRAKVGYCQERASVSPVNPDADWQGDEQSHERVNSGKTCDQTRVTGQRCCEKRNGHERQTIGKIRCGIRAQ